MPIDPGQARTTGERPQSRHRQAVRRRHRRQRNEQPRRVAGAGKSRSGASRRRACAQVRRDRRRNRRPVRRRPRQRGGPAQRRRRSRVHAHVQDAAGTAPLSCCSATSACSNPISTAASTSTAISPSPFAPASTAATTASGIRWSRCATAGTSGGYSNRSLPQAKANARFHYGLGKAFYEPWLDAPAMMYTCAYWSEGTTTLEEAQRNKMDHVCRKVRLQPGETFVDVGCGWGGLMFHAWEHYGASAPGSTRPPNRSRNCGPRSRAAGSTTTLRVVEADFREMPGQYDKLLSIGTLEHAGPDQLPEVVQRARRRDEAGRPRRHPLHRPRRRARHRVLHPQLHLSGRLDPEPRAGARRDGALRARGARRREPAPPLRADARLLGRALRPQLGARSTRSTRVRFDERFRRIWRTYLWSCAEVFRGKDVQLNLFQVTVSKGNVGNRYPMSRSFLYAPADVTRRTPTKKARLARGPRRGAAARRGRVGLGEADVEPLPRPRAEAAAARSTSRPSTT